jgi:hypothetical protein
MRYLLAAMNAHQFARFAYVNVNGVKEWSALKDALNLDESAHTGETVMIFNDLPQVCMRVYASVLIVTHRTDQLRDCRR